MLRNLIGVLSFIGLVCVVGCAQYDYDVIRPTDLATHVNAKSDSTLPRDPLSYRLRAAEDRLVISVVNPTDDTIRLLGDQSSVVDFNGQSHPLRSQAIAPQSFVKLILPPYRPTIEQTGPTFGIGIGGGVGDRRRLRDDRFDDTFDDQPRYLTVNDGDALYWSWSGEGTIRLSLVFQRNDSTFRHDFSIQRVKRK